MQRIFIVKRIAEILTAAILAIIVVIGLGAKVHASSHAASGAAAAGSAVAAAAAAVDFTTGDCSALTGSERTKCEACRGAGAAGYNGTCTDSSGTAAEGQVSGLVTDAINIFSFVVGIISVIMIIVGGLKYVMSSGDSGNITSAKNTILYAIIGLVVVAFAQVIVLFVINKTTATPPATSPSAPATP